MRKCEIEGCRGRYKWRGKCTRHYNEWLYTTFPEKKERKAQQDAVLIARRRAEDPKGSNAYLNAHRAVKRIHGKASQYTCTNFNECGSFAEQWALDESSKEIVYSKYYHWSPNPEDYIPMCVICHKEYDRRESIARNNA